jgi:hypothetical protein
LIYITIDSGGAGMGWHKSLTSSFVSCGIWVSGVFGYGFWWSFTGVQLPILVSDQPIGKMGFGSGLENLGSVF